MSASFIRRRAVIGGLGALASSPAVAAAGKRPRVAVRTDHGQFTVELEAAKVPITCANFLRYVDAGKYDGGDFYRATHAPGAPQEGTIVGSPSPRSHPFPPIAHESTTATGLRHVSGTISLGRFAPGTGTSNFFICLGAIPAYDAHPGAKGDNLGFAAFGQVVSGMAVVNRIHALPANGHSPFAEQKGEWLSRPALIVSMRRTV